MFSTFIEVNDYLNSLVSYEHTFPLGGKRGRPKLQPTLDAMERLGLSRSLPRCVHIAGTVGKGSVAGFTESILSTSYRTLTFTSPHIISPKERVRLNGMDLDDEIWCKGFSSLVEALRRAPVISLTYFESMFVFYLWASKELKCESHVVETGLGGSFDVTNVLENTTAVLTLIDLDHTKILGESRAEIAADKCGIIKSGSNAITCMQHEDCLPVIQQASAIQQAILSVYERDFRTIEYSHDELTYSDSSRTIGGLQLAVKEFYQRENAAIAIRAAITVAPELTDDAIRRGLAAYLPPARQQLLPGIPPILVDVAHNPIAFEMLAKTLREKHSERRIKAVIGMMKDKDARSCLTHLRGLVERLLIVSTGNPRSYLPEELRDIALEVGIPARAYSENQYAYLDLHEDRMITLGLVSGSFYVAGDYLQWRDHAGVA